VPQVVQTQAGFSLVFKCCVKAASSGGHRVRAAAAGQTGLVHASAGNLFLLTLRLKARAATQWIHFGLAAKRLTTPQKESVDSRIVALGRAGHGWCRGTRRACIAQVDGPSSVWTAALRLAIRRHE
jgi:hypothetical protein